MANKRSKIDHQDKVQLVENILIVEDEKNIRDMIAVYLNSQKYRVLKASNYLEAEDLINSEKRINLIILDWMIPIGDGNLVNQEFNGVDLLHEIKKNPRRKNVPVIILSAKVEVDDRITGLDAGADDYLTKPVALRELLARIQAHLRRSGAESKNNIKNSLVKYGGIVIDPVAHRVLIDHKMIQIRRIEFKLLLFFMTYPDQVFSREELLDGVWGVHTFVAPRTVDVSVGRLKKILAQTRHDQLLQTIRGKGYRFSIISNTA